MNKLKSAGEFIAERWSSYCFSVTSVGQGFLLCFNPQLIDHNEAYEFLSRAFDFLESRWFGVLFLVFGLLKLMATTLNLRMLRIVTLLSLMFLWTSLSFALGMQALNGSINTVWWLSLSVAANGLNVVIAGRVKK